MNRMRITFALTLMFAPLALEGCALFKATGRTVEATGEGAGHAVAETGRAITQIPADLNDDARRRY